VIHKTCQKGKQKVEMATEGHERGQREGYKKKINPEMDLELNEIRARMEQLALRMQQEEKVH
jgi:hypothetical protein